MVAFYQPCSDDVGAIGDREPHGGTIDLPTGRRQCGLQPATQLSVSELIDDLLKLRLRESQSLFEETLANLQRIVDGKRSHAVALQSDCGLLSFESFRAAQHHEGQQHLLQTGQSSLSRSFPRR